MDFNKIVLQGLTENPKFLTDYFYRELQNAIDKSYSKEEFFTKIETSLNQILKKLNEPYLKELDKLNDALMRYENGIYFIDNDKNKTESWLKEYETQIENNKNSVLMPVHLIFKGYNEYNFKVNHKQINGAKESLNKAKEKESQNKDPEPIQHTFTKQSDRKKPLLERLNTTINKVNLLNKIKPLKADYSNIDEVYNNNLTLWLYNNSHSRKDHSERDKDGFSNNIVNGWIKDPSKLEFSKTTENGFELTEVDFIDYETDLLAEFDTKTLSLEQTKKFKMYMEFVSRQKSEATWTMQDYYKHYLKYKRLSIIFIKSYESKDYEKAIDRLKNYKERYFYIFDRIDDKERTLLKNNFCESLKHFSKNQKLDLFRELTNNLIIEIESHYTNYKLNLESEIPNYKKGITSALLINLDYNEWFKNENDEIDSNTAINKYSKELKPFIYSLDGFVKDTISLFTFIDNYKPEPAFINSFNIKRGKLKESLTHINSYSVLISELQLKGENDKALLLQKYYTTKLKGILSNFKTFGIDFMKTPFKKELKNIFKSFEKAYTTELKPFKIKNQINEQSNNDEVKKEMHNHIFKGNAFEVFQSMFNSFKITKSSRTDVKFIFEEMKKDKLIHNTVNQTTFLNWLSEPPFQITVEKTSNYSKTTTRNSIYSNAKQLYKSEGT